MKALVLASINGKKVHNLREAVKMVEESKDEYITFDFEGNYPITLNLNKLRTATPKILKRYHISADRYFED